MSQMLVPAPISVCCDDVKPISFTKTGHLSLAVTHAFLCLHMLPETLEVPRAGEQVKKSKRKGRNKQEAPAHAEPSTYVEEVKTPLDLAKVSGSGT